METEVTKPNDTEETRIKAEDFILNDTDKKVLTYCLEYPELKGKEIAKLLNINETHFSEIRNKPAFKKAYKLYTDKAIDIITNSKTEAAITLTKLLKSKNDNVRMNTAKSLLGDLLTTELVSLKDINIKIEIVKPDSDKSSV
jgi:hypothetical protein